MNVIFFLLFGMFLLAAPHHAQSADSADSEPLDFLGKVVYVKLEGGFYGIISKDKKRYKPINLPELLAEENLTVHVTAKELRNVFGIHMWGSYIEILTIEEVECENSAALENCEPVPPLIELEKTEKDDVEEEDET